MKLMIVESPNKTKKIKAILGEGWDVAASVGHFGDLPPKELGVGADFALTYEYTERGKATIDALKRAHPQACRLPDRTSPRLLSSLSASGVPFLSCPSVRALFGEVTEVTLDKLLDITFG